MFEFAMLMSDGGSALVFNGVFTTSSGTSPVTSATRTLTGNGTIRFDTIGGVTTSVQYSLNGGAWTTITEGLTLAMVSGDTLAVRSAIVVVSNTTTFNLINHSNGSVIEFVTLTRT